MRLRLQQEEVDLRLKIVTVLEAQEEVRRKGVEMEKNRDKSSDCYDVEDVY